MKFSQFFNKRISSRENPRIVSNAIILDRRSVEDLKMKFPGVHRKHSGEHVTLDYGTNKYHENFGENVEVTVDGYAKDDMAEAVHVSIPGVRCDKPNPHITISYDDGVKPVYSNELLAKGYKKIQPFMLHGTVGSFINGKYTTEKP